jgi:hypothetical protein
MYMNDLVGKSVRDARFDGDSIFLNMDGGGCISLTPYGDCCANCYIQNVSGSEALVDAVITGVEDLVCEASQEEIDNADTIDAWGHRIVTDKGICTIEMRVSHNGYYGGSLDPSHSDVESQDKVLEDF